MNSKRDMFQVMYDGSWYTIVGAGGDLNEWREGYQRMLTEQGIGKIKEWHTFKGREMNQRYGLTGNNAYPDGLTFLAFSIEGLNVEKLAVFKLRMEDRWFDDIVDNNAAREAAGS